MWAQFKIRIIDIDVDGNPTQGGESLYTLGSYDMTELRAFYATRDNRGVDCVIMEFYDNDRTLCVYNPYKEVKQVLDPLINANS